VSKTSRQQSGVTESLVEVILGQPTLDLGFARPASNDFFQKIEKILQDPAGLHRFFRQSLFVWNELDRRLDKRTWSAEDIPRSPRTLEPLPVTNAPIDEYSMRVMAEYRSQ
jgi:hypothetical protein